MGTFFRDVAARQGPTWDKTSQVLSVSGVNQDLILLARQGA
jgi:hypothetical protein